MEILATYIPPGHLRLEGPRHDNDHAEIHQIGVGPSHRSWYALLHPIFPRIWLVHHSDSMERLLGIQLRLLRENLLLAIRHSLRVHF